MSTEPVVDAAEPAKEAVEEKEKKTDVQKPVPVKNNKKKWIAIGLILISILGGGAAYFFLSGTDDPSSAQSEKASPADDPLATARQLMDDDLLSDAVTAARTVYINDPKNIEAYSLAALINFKMGVYTAAIDTARKALKIDPDRAKDHALIGASFYQFANFESALEESIIALRLDPDYYLPYITIGDIYAKRNELTDSIKILKQAARLKPGNAHIWDKLSSVYYKLEDKKNAEIAAKAAIELDWLETPSAHFTLAQIYYRRNDGVQAVKHIQEAEQIFITREDTMWAAKARQTKDHIIEHFKMRAGDIETGLAN